jgi:hypothetical protein
VICLAEVAVKWPSPQEHGKRLVKLVAFVCRYGHQQAMWCWSQPLSDLKKFADALGELLSEEQKVTPSED